MTTRRLAYFEWSADSSADTHDRQAWAAANPALGIRIDEDAIEVELGAMEDDDFRRERLGIWHMPTEATDPAISDEQWQACLSPGSRVTGPLTIGFEVSVDRQWSQIAVAAESTMGGVHVEIIDNRRGTGWVVPRLLELQDSYSPSSTAANPAGPAGGLIPEAEKAGLAIGVADEGKTRAMSGRDYSQACQAAYDAIIGRRWRHIGQPELTVAVAGAAKRNVGDTFVFDRRGRIDISPFLAVVVAAWAHGRRRPRRTREPFVVVT